MSGISLLAWTIVISVVIASPINAADLTLVITAYKALGDVYIDGQSLPLPNKLNWSLPDYATLPPTTRLITVEALNMAEPQCGGVLASVGDAYLLTNNKWKCSKYNYVGWTELGYDDSSWPNAVEYGSNGNHLSCSQQQLFIDISANSQWIWTNSLTNDLAIYCRGYLPLCETSSPCLNGGTCLPNDIKMCDCTPQYTGTYCETDLLNGTLAITAYQQLLELYIDGQQQLLTNGNNWTLTDHAAMSKTNRLIAVIAKGNGNCGGLLASFDGAYVLTNNKWRCSPYQYGGWNLLGFDDSVWPYAVEFGSNANGHTSCSQMYYISAIDPNAMWIWVNDQQEITIYCRGYLPVCDSSPCLNGGTCLENDARLCNCSPLFTGIYCETDLPLVITAYQALGDVYIDGQSLTLPNKLNWSLPDNATLPSTTRLIAVQALNLADRQCSGVLASVGDAYLLTNNKWKCSKYNCVGWTELGYDDSSWPNAVEYGSNGNHLSCNQQQFFGDISSNSQWIWTNSLTDFAIYCRVYLPLCETASPCLNGGTCLPNDIKMCDCTPQYTGTYCETELLNGTLAITALHELLELDIDGQPQSLTNGNNWSQTDHAALSKTNRLIAVIAKGNGNCGGLLASFDGAYVLTNNKWRCSPYQYGGWNLLGFDDSVWDYAVEFGSNANGHTSCSQIHLIPDIDPNAMWIWVNDQQELTIYCRGYLPVCDSSPCLNGGTCLENDARLCNCPPQFTGVNCETDLLLFGSEL